MSYNFNVENVTNELIQWIRDWFKINGEKCNCILGISGGKDSTVVGKLCVEALGKERVKGVLLPNGEQHDVDVARKVCEYLGITYYEWNIYNIYNIFQDTYMGHIGNLDESLLPTEQSDINLAPRIRMTALRYVAQTMNGRLANTSNYSEDWVGYATIDGDEVTMTVTASAFGFIKTRVFLTFTVETDDDNYTLIIKKGKLGKLNIFSKLALNIVKKATLDKTLNDFLNDQNIPFVFDVDKLVFTSSKADFSAWINDLLSSDEEDSSTLMASTLIDVLLSPENDFVTFGMIDENEFGVDINLEVLRVDESKVTLDPRIKEPFDKDSLIKNLSQTIAINMLNGDGLYATFTELDINKLIYSSTDGYSSFASSSEIMEGVYFDFSIDGIIFDIKENGDAITLNIILNINGLLTLATYSGTTNQVSDTMIVIKMEDYLYLGNDLAVDSSFIGALLEENLNDSTFLSYDRSANAFTLSSSIFDDYLNEGSIAHNFHVNGINFITDALNVTLVSLNPITNLTISNASNLIKEALKVDFLDLSEFSDETEAISNVIDELESIKEQLNDPNFNESDLDTSSLVSAINELTTEEQETFFNQLQAQAGSDAINDLYNELFGGLS